MGDSTGAEAVRIPRRRGGFILPLGLVLFGCVSALLILETGLRVMWRPELASWPRNLDIVFPLDPEVTTGVAGPARIKTNSRGLRGTEWSADRSSEYRILVLGGSTAECLAQDQPNTWPALLQAMMPVRPDGRHVWVGNAGRGGHNSRHHVLAMREMPAQYDPDAVIVLVGGNDPARALNEGPAYDVGFIDDERKMRGLAGDFSERPAFPAGANGLSLRSLRLLTYLRDLGIRGRSEHGFVQSVTGYRAMQVRRRQAARIVDEAPDIGRGLEGFRRNLREIIRLARERRIRLVFLTQPSLYKPDMPEEEVRRLWAGWAGDPGGNAYWSHGVLAAAVEAHRRIVLETSRSEGLDCLDLASRFPKTTAVTWDQAHFTDTGSRLVAEDLLRYFSAHPEETQGPAGVKRDQPGRSPARGRG